MKKYLIAHHRWIGFVATLICLIVALVYLKVLPDEVNESQGIRAVILTYGHSLCWFLLAGASGLWALRRQSKWSVVLAYLALASYLIFMATFMLAKLA